MATSSERAAALEAAQELIMAPAGDEIAQAKLLAIAVFLLGDLLDNISRATMALEDIGGVLRTIDYNRKHP